MGRDIKVVNTTVSLFLVCFSSSFKFVFVFIYLFFIGLRNYACLSPSRFSPPYFFKLKLSKFISILVSHKKYYEELHNQILKMVLHILYTPAYCKANKNKNQKKSVQKLPWSLQFDFFIEFVTFSIVFFFFFFKFLSTLVRSGSHFSILKYPASNYEVLLQNINGPILFHFTICWWEDLL